MTRGRAKASEAYVLERALAFCPKFTRSVDIVSVFEALVTLMTLLPSARAACSASWCASGHAFLHIGRGGIIGRSVRTRGISTKHVLLWRSMEIVPTGNKRRLYNSLLSTANSSDPPTKKSKELYEGAYDSSSEFVTHFIAGAQAKAGTLMVEDAVQSVIPAVDYEGNSGDHAAAAEQRREMILHNEQDVLLKAASPALRHDPRNFPPVNEPLSAIDLLALGSIWYLPAGAPRDPARGGKPIRLSAADAGRILHEGDYLRIHHSPRRFPMINYFNWGRFVDKTEMTKQEPPGVIIAQNDEVGYMIIDKPAGIGVHPTVDNLLENVSAAIGRSLLKQREAALRASVERGGESSSESRDASTKSSKRKKRGHKQKEEPLIYISSPQRLDQNTSGLFVLSTNKEFASYFAKLLRKKTDDNLSDENRSSSIHKTYKCLVCVSPEQGRKDVSDSASSTSVVDELARLRKYASERTIIKHYLEPSIRAPKNFELVPGNATWAECLLRITNVGQASAVVGSGAAESLSNALWKNSEKPEACVAVAEVEVELLTGRTHQIRGQLSAEGFPLVGDAQYGGAVPQSLPEASSLKGPGEKLALQCCQLEFLDPDFVTDKKERSVAFRSDRWKTFQLNKAWWTPVIEEYEKMTEGTESDVTFSAADEEQVRILKATEALVSKDNATVESTSSDRANVALPRRVQLSPGVHKYVIIKSTRPSSEPLWFVRSASPAECGGPYHANVAQSLVGELGALGFESIVTGGGRIDFAPPHAHVYGFSFGFGKGDHEMAAKIIEECSEDETYATFDNSDGIY